MAPCDICLELQPPYPNVLIPFSDLAASAQSKSCSSCRLLHNGIIAREEDKILTEDVSLSDRYGTLSISLSPLSPLYFAERGPGNSTPMRRMFFHVLPGQASPWPSIKEKPSISGDTGSEKALSWVLENLRACRESHHECPKSDTQLPTRVLDVGSSDEGDGGIKLYITQGEVAPYICLSYCWGKIENTAKTIQSTLEEFQKCAWGTLPKTFQEAIIVTRRLGIRYLWIDSLCIIQGDEDDWRMEVSRMFSVYQGSTLTIFATDSFDTQGGLFRKSPPVDMSRKVLGGTTDGCRWEVYVAPDLMDIQKFPYYPDAFPLFSRAWVLQERLLSPRQLHFGASELEWKCENRILSENSVKYPSKSVWTAPLESLTLPGKNWIHHWQEVIKHYTSLKLSSESDRLPAVSGVAKLVAESMKCDYLAGMWRDTLIQDLLWWNMDKNGSRTSKPLAPSWSWASVNGPIDYWKFTSPLCRVLECFCHYVVPHSFGQVSSGLLTISGSVEQVRHIGEAIPEESSEDWGPEQDPRILHSGSGEAKKVSPDYQWYDDGYGRIDRDEIVYLLKAAKTEQHLFSLALRCLNFPTQTYERIGFLVEKISAVERGIEYPSYEGIQREETIHII